MTIGTDETDSDLLLSKQYGDIFSSTYVTKQMLGKGVSSTVRMCIHRETSKSFAVKIIDITSQKHSDQTTAIKNEYSNEVAILSKLSRPPKHRNISKSNLSMGKLEADASPFQVCYFVVVWARGEKGSFSLMADFEAKLHFYGTI